MWSYLKKQAFQKLYFILTLFFLNFFIPCATILFIATHLIRLFKFPQNLQTKTPSNLQQISITRKHRRIHVYCPGFCHLSSSSFDPPPNGNFSYGTKRPISFITNSSNLLRNLSTNPTNDNEVNRPSRTPIQE